MVPLVGIGQERAAPQIVVDRLIQAVALFIAIGQGHEGIGEIGPHAQVFALPAGPPVIERIVGIHLVKEPARGFQVYYDTLFRQLNEIRVPPGELRRLEREHLVDRGLHDKIRGQPGAVGHRHRGGEINRFPPVVGPQNMQHELVLRQKAGPFGIGDLQAVEFEFHLFVVDHSADRVELLIAQVNRDFRLLVPHLLHVPGDIEQAQVDHPAILAHVLHLLDVPQGKGVIVPVGEKQGVRLERIHQVSRIGRRDIVAAAVDFSVV